jgi:competence protein ComEC
VDTMRSRAAATVRTVWSATVLLLSLASVLGVLAGALIAPPAGLVAGIALTGLAAAAIGRHRRHIWLPGLLLVPLALGLWRFEATRPPTGTAGLPLYVGRDVTLVGTVAAEPEPLDRGENVRVAVETLAAGGITRRVSGLVLVHLGGLTGPAYGDHISLAGALASPPDLPGASPGSYRAYLAAQGIYAVLNYPRLRHLGTGAGNPLLALAIALRRLLEGGIRHILPGPEAALLLGILLGTRTRALGALTMPFIATGMIHVVAISGLKVSIVAGTTDRLARRLVGRRVALPMTLAVLLLYVLVTGATPAGLRAAVMWTLALLALRFGRRSDAVTSLALAAALLALVSPRILWDLGFQLSLAGTAAIVLLEPGIERRLGRVPLVAREAMAVTLAAQAGTLPLLISGFGQVSLLAPLANALLLPLLSPIMALGLPAALAGALAPPLGALLGLVVYPLLAAMIVGVQVLAWPPFAALPAGPWPVPVVAGYYALLGLAAWGPLRVIGAVSRTHLSVRPLPAAVATGALLLATVAWQAPPPLYTLSLLGLGGGQALLVTTPGGHTLLIDGGDAPSLLAAALGARLPFWRAHLDAVMLSDIDPAHVGGLRGLTARYTLDRALDPGAVYPSATYALWRAELRDAGVPERKLRTGARYRLDRACSLDVLLPAGLTPVAPAAPVALRLMLGRFSLLLLNRAALAAAPADLLANGARGATALVLPAGADDPSVYGALVRLLRPRLVVLPSTDDAREDPTADRVALRAAHALGARVWQGDDGASLEIITDGARYRVQGSH